MRTVDPEVWYPKLKKPTIQVSRRMKFGQRPGRSLEMRLRESFRDAIAEFWRNFSLGAAKYMNVDNAIIYARYGHFAILVLTLMLGAIITNSNYQELHERPPLIVTLQSTDKSIVNFKFPAVALCSNNIISRAALKNLTYYMYTHPKNRKYRYNESDIEHNLLNLGALLTLALPPLKPNFERFMRDVEPNVNVTDLMFKLSPNCSAILQRCSWRAQIVECDSLFATRLTALGFCCVFNSRYQPVDFYREPAVLDLIGQDYGLGVVIKEQRDDFAYVRRPAYGMELLLFAGDEYPLLESGDVRMYPLARNTSLYLAVRALTQLPADDIRDYSEEWRGCRMHGSGLSQCLTQCRRDTVEALCGCAPYALQPHGAPHAAPTCTFSRLGCLNKHREKFMYLYPGEEADAALSQEKQDALVCPYCLVLCQRQQYSAEIFYSHYDTKTSIFRNFLSDGLSLINATVIRLYYNIDHQKWYKVEAYRRWYEVFVKLSSQWMVVTGVSLLSYSELVYHFTFRWLHHFIRRTRIANMRPLATST